MNNKAIDELAEQVSKSILSSRIAAKDPALVLIVSALSELLLIKLIEYRELVNELSDIEEKDLVKCLPEQYQHNSSQKRMVFLQKVVAKTKNRLKALVQVQALLKDWSNTLDEIPENNRDILSELEDKVYDFLELKANVQQKSEGLKCGNSNPPCAANLKFGMLECSECNH